ncbi:MAG: tetratricopeptide repeat protein, partial [Planctomycetota bacterium]
MTEQTAGDGSVEDTASKDSSNSQAERPQLSRRRRWAFRIILIVVIPLVLLALTEVGLRLAGVGYRTAFFLRIPDADAYTTNPIFGWRFFPRPLSREPLALRLPARKGPQTYRIFVLGASAAQGVPDPTVSSSRVLEAMLEQTYPHAQFEVMNVAMTAINSHVVLPIARECARFEPDLFIVYLGNNEVTGPYGAATVFGAFNKNLTVIRSSLWLKTTALGQLAERITRSMGEQEFSFWMGMEMFHAVSRDDPSLETIADHLRANLRDICQAAAGAGADVILSTVAVNLTDCPPFGSAHRADLSEADLAAWEGFVEAGIGAEERGDIQGAIAAYQDAARIDPEFAELQFRLAQSHLAAGEADEAAAAFALARDLDTLRFRTDSNINRVIREVAARHQDRGVVLIDADRELRQAGEGAAPADRDLFYEHVHLTFEGNYRLARLMFPKVVERLPESIRSQAAAPRPPSRSDCEARLALTDWQRLQSVSYILTMIERPPFTTQLGYHRRRAHWQEHLERLRSSLDPETVAAMTQRYRDAIKLAEDDLALRTTFAHFLQFAGDLPEAREQARYVLEALPTNAAAHFVMGTVCYGLGDMTAAQTHFQETVSLAADQAEAYAEIAEFLLRYQQLDEAEAFCRKSLDIRPNSPKVLQAVG